METRKIEIITINDVDYCGMNYIRRKFTNEHTQLVNWSNIIKRYKCNYIVFDNIVHLYEYKQAIQICKKYTENYRKKNIENN